MLPVRDVVPHTAVRIRFSKTGALQYISHLDLHRTFTRLLVRRGVPVWYSEGFSPHPRLVFATPLSVGTESVCEFVDVQVTGLPEEVNISDLASRLRDSGIEGLSIQDVYLPEMKFSSITHADYEIRFHLPCAGETMAAGCAAALSSSPLIVLKRTKSGERETDISAQIRSVSVFLQDDKLLIAARLSADSAHFFNPEFLGRILRARCGVPDDSYSILRTNVLCGENSFR